MKKKLISIGASVAMLLGGGVSAMANTHFSSSFLSGTYLVVSNSVTVSQTSSNVWFYSYAAGTNVQSFATNAAGILYPAAIVDSPMIADVNSDVNPNIAVQIVVGYSNNIFAASVQTPVVNTWTNPIPAIPVNSLSTNVVTVTLSTVSSVALGLADTSTGKTFTFSITANGTTPVVVSTNLPTSFLQGAGAIRATVGVGGGTGSGIVVNALNLTGWKP